MYWMIDLHTHTLFSDGVLLPFELARRAEAAGYKAIAFTDHVDPSNIEHVVTSLVRAASELRGEIGVKVIPGAELTHVPPKLIGKLAERARDLGALVVLVHGETLVEPVAPGTNLAAIEAGVDILAHPGLITPEEAALAAKLGVALEISTRKGHSLTNGHVARVGLEAGATLVINNDAHEPRDLVDEAQARRIFIGAGQDEKAYNGAITASRIIVEKAFGRIDA